MRNFKLQAVLICTILWSSVASQNPENPISGDLWCPVDEIQYFSSNQSTGEIIANPDTAAIRLFYIYSRDDLANYGIDSSEFERAILLMTVQMGNRVNHRSGIVDSSKNNAYEIVGIKSIPEYMFGNITHGCNVLSDFRQPNNGILDEEYEDFICSDAHTAVIITPEYVSRPNGCATGSTVCQIRSFWIWAYYTQGLIPYENANSRSDSVQAMNLMENRANTLFHELGHNYGGKHFSGQGIDETIGVFKGRSKYGTLPSLMDGAYGNSAFHYSNIYGPEPLTDGIVNHASHIIANRLNGHKKSPQLKLSVNAIRDTIYLNTEDSTFTRIDLNVNRQDWEDNGELRYSVLRPNGSLHQLNMNSFFLAATARTIGMKEGKNDWVAYVKRDCDYGPTAIDSFSIWVKDLMTTSSQTHRSPFFNVYPNPAKNVLLITTSENVTFTLHDLNGREIINQRLMPGNNTISTAKLHRGTYVITLLSNEYKILDTRKILINE